MAKFCMNCGKQLDDAVKFCASCGTKQQPAQQAQIQQPMPMQAMQLNQSAPVHSVQSPPQVQPPQMQQAQLPQMQQQPPQTQSYTQPQQYGQPQHQQSYTPTQAAMPAPKKSKTPLILGGALAIVIVVVVIATNVFSPIGKGGGAGDDNSSSRTLSPSATISMDGATTAPTLTPEPEPTEEPEQTPTPEPTQSTDDDAVSINALVGSWYWYDEQTTGYMWIFDAHGNYARLRATSTTTTNPAGSTWQFAARNVRVGNYRVRGHVIECFNNEHSQDNDLSWNPYGEGWTNAAVDELMRTPLSDSSDFRDFTIHFEFVDSMTLRLVSVEPNRDDNYLADFNYQNSDSHNVTIPTHRIPSREWPAKELLPPDTVEYPGGRIQFVNTYASDLIIYIDETTSAEYANYLELMVQAGWTELNADPDIHEGLRQGKYTNDGTSLRNGPNEFTIGYDNGVVILNLVRRGNW